MPRAGKPNILLIAGEAAGLQALRTLTQADCRIVAVMACVDAPPKTACPCVATAAIELGYPVWPARLIKDPEIAGTIRREEIDLLLNVHSRYIIPGPALASARVGAFNLHPGPLPEYAGLNVVSWTIYNGEPTHAVTLHWMAEQIDAGDIAYQASFPIEDADTPLSLTHKCIKTGVPLIVRLVEAASRGAESIPRIRQDLAKRRYYGRGAPDNGRLEWARPAREILRFIRACDYAPFSSPWGHPQTTCGGLELGISKAALSERKCDASPGAVGECGDAGAVVATADRWLIVSRIEVDGRSMHPQLVLKRGAQLGASHVTHVTAGAADAPVEMNTQE